MKPRIMKARYKGRCTVCSTSFKAGTRIQFVSVAGGDSILVGLSCHYEAATDALLDKMGIVFEKPPPGPLRSPVKRKAPKCPPLPKQSIPRRVNVSYADQIAVAEAAKRKRDPWRD